MIIEFSHCEKKGSTMKNEEQDGLRKSGMTIKQVSNARFAVSHAERTDLHEASYLLPHADRLENRVVFGGNRESEIAEIFEKRKANLSRQALAARASPFFEAVCVLPEVEQFESVDAYHEAMSERLLTLKNELESRYGFTVLLIAVHLDEGHKDEEFGQLKRNPHAHILIDRAVPLEKKRVRKRDEKVKKKRPVDPNQLNLWQPTEPQLVRIQTMTAEILHMQRGLTKEDRDGKPSRPNINHVAFRQLKAAHEKEKNKLIDDFAVTITQMQHAERARVEPLEQENAALRAQLAAHQEESRKAAYAACRAFLKGTGLAKQRGYQTLKMLYERRSNLIEQIANYIDRNEDDQIDLSLIFDTLDRENPQQEEEQGSDPSP